VIYLDNAATSWPKPPSVIKAMADALEQAGGNPGRSGHRLSIAAARIIYDTREELARFFGVADPSRVIFTANATQAINLALRGILKPGDSVVTSSVEHNSVMRPLRHLAREGVGLSIARCAADGSFFLSQLDSLVSPGVRLVVVTHASNVVGTILPIKAIADIAHRAGALLLVDAAQTAGAVPVNMPEMGIDLLAFAGHKELLGPPGTGGLVIGQGVDVSQIEPLLRGGTGSRSESEEQPVDLPDRYESGTANFPGIAGLGAGLKYLASIGIDQIRDRGKQLSRILFDGLKPLPGVMVYGTGDPERSVPIVSFTVSGKRVSDIGFRLDEEFGLLCRVGLHCAPAAHRTIGSFPEGTVRLSPGVSTTADEAREAVKVIARVVAG